MLRGKMDRKEAKLQRSQEAHSGTRVVKYVLQKPEKKGNKNKQANKQTYTHKNRRKL
jgi:hypothetical protein